MFDNNNDGQKSVFWGCHLHRFLHLLQFDYSPFSRICSLLRRSPQNVENCRISVREECVNFCHVSGCHGFFAPDRRCFVMASSKQGF